MHGDPGEREAERLRIIMQAFLEADPFMKLQQAIPAIFETEKRTAELERQQVHEVSKGFELPDSRADTVAKWIDLRTDVQALINDGKKVQAIKEVRAGCTYGGVPLGLKEAKDGVEYWMTGFAAPAPPTTAGGRMAPGTIALWMTFTDQEDIRELMRDGKRIYAIKEVRTRYGAGLREAKDGVEQWEKIYA